MLQEAIWEKFISSCTIWAKIITENRVAEEIVFRINKCRNIRTPQSWTPYWLISALHRVCWPEEKRREERGEGKRGGEKERKGERKREREEKEGREKEGRERRKRKKGREREKEREPPLCVDSKRLRVYFQKASVCTGLMSSSMRRACLPTTTTLRCCTSSRPSIAKRSRSPMFLRLRQWHLLQLAQLLLQSIVCNSIEKLKMPWPTELPLSFSPKKRQPA